MVKHGWNKSFGELLHDLLGDYLGCRPFYSKKTNCRRNSQPNRPSRRLIHLNWRR
jgi:hypothetical protein